MSHDLKLAPPLVCRRHPVSNSQRLRSHRRHSSEPGVFRLISDQQDKRIFAFPPIQQSMDTPQTDYLTPPRALRPGFQTGTLCSRPPTELFGQNELHIHPPKPLIGSPAFKLAAIKERLRMLEDENERLTHRIESCKTDAEMLSSSVTYFSSEYYAGLLTIRDLRSRSRQDAEMMSNQEQQLCQLKKFVGLMVEIGLHEPVLERAHEAVLAGDKLEQVLVSAIRIAASRPGSAWASLLSSININPTPVSSDEGPGTTSTPIVPRALAENQTNTVDNLLKNLRNGDIPSGRHRSATQRSRLSTNRSSASKSSTSTTAVATPSPRPPARMVLGNLDVNRTGERKGAQSLKTVQVPKTGNHSNKDPHTRSTGRGPRPDESKPIPSKIPFSTQQAIDSLQHILDGFGSASIGSLGTSSEESQSERGNISITQTATPSNKSSTCVVVKSPPLVRVRPTTAPIPTRKCKHLSAVPAPVKRTTEPGSPSRPYSLASPGRLLGRTYVSGKAGGNDLRQGGWR
ncbi:hypothetical protein C8J57DRAFT_52695 [Mycena rebaudengoi]|nr:hypothetical protein C8J57DRAFT_52695 [Mycena rebaudengoi]